jgi:hypothetical protein
MPFSDAFRFLKLRLRRQDRPRRLSLRWIAFGALACLTLPECSLRHAVRGTPFFAPFRAVASTVIPPVRGLELWIEGDTLAGDASGVVASWPDMRGQNMGQVRVWRPVDGTVMSGTVATLTIRTPLGVNRSVRALRCATTPRCSYVFADPAGRARLDVLTGRPYAIFAVARRTSSRGDQYVVMTEGVGCDTVTGINCTENTALHLGWSGQETLRLDHYGNASFIEGVPAFNAASPSRSLIIGQSDSRGKRISLLELFCNCSHLAPDTRPLGTTRRLYVGGTPWADNNDVPNWFFVGDIFAVLVYSVEVSDAERSEVANYLRTRYGPL